MPQSPDDLPAREILEVGRRMGDHIDQNAVKRASEAVRDHEQRMHAESETVAEDLDLPTGEKLSDADLWSIYQQADREQVSYAYVCELRGISYARFQLDFADFRRRYKEKVRKAGMTR
jgi:hypothetical protein